MPYTPMVERTSVTIANTATISTTIDLGGATLVGLEIPTVTAATFSFKSLAADGATMLPVYRDDGILYSVTATDNAYVAVDPTYLSGVRSIQLIGNTAEAGGSTITIQLVYRPV